MAQRFILQQAARILHAGGVIAYPTEGVYGLGCLPDDPAAVDYLLSIKQRRMQAGLILIAAHLAQLDEWIAPDDQEQQSLMITTGQPTTWIVTAAANTPPWLTGGRSTLAVRITDHPAARDLCIAADSALVSTSANRSGHRAARTALQTRRWLGTVVDFVVPGATGGASGPSEIRVARTGAIIRPAMTTQAG